MGERAPAPEAAPEVGLVHHDLSRFEPRMARHEGARGPRALRTGPEFGAIALHVHHGAHGLHGRVGQEGRPELEIHGLGRPIQSSGHIAGAFRFLSALGKGFRVVGAEARGGRAV